MVISHHLMGEDRGSEMANTQAGFSQQVEAGPASRKDGRRRGGASGGVTRPCSSAALLVEAEVEKVLRSYPRPPAH